MLQNTQISTDINLQVLHKLERSATEILKQKLTKMFHESQYNPNTQTG